MQLILSNPLGWWGLTMIPALVLIHCLHRNRRPLVISTLFLVQRGSMERRGGRKFVFWKHSIAFWLQVLAALLITWLLLQPHWIGPQTTQRIALVLDNSLSMEAFQDTLTAALRTETTSLEKTAARTDWLLMESNPRAPVLYRGPDREALLRAAGQWRPRLGTHDWTGAVGTARALVGTDGAVIFVTDHVPAERPHGVAVLSVGTPLDNVGFAGLHVGMHAGDAVWQAMLRNYSDRPVERQWWIEINGERTEPRRAQLPANGTLALSGSLPAGVSAMTLVLEDDTWSIDNRLPLVWPEPKRIAYQVSIENPDTASVLRNLLKSLGETYQGTLNGRTDLLAAESDELHPIASRAPNQILFAPSGSKSSLPPGLLNAEAHPLNEGLNWNGLTVRGGVLPRQLGPGEAPLVWLGGTPLIWLRERADGRDLVFNFSLRESNALKLPATVLLIGRFVSELREAKPGYEAANFELGQRVTVTLPADAKEVRVNGESVPPSPRLALDAPDRSGPLEVTVDGEPLLRGAAHFADVREADLRHADTLSELAALRRELIETNSETDAHQVWWVLLLTGVLLASWHYAERGR